MKKFGRLLLILALLNASPALAAQGTIVGPVAGPMNMSSVMAIVNAAFQAIQSCNSGTVAPANGTGGLPTQFECWADTSGSPTVSIKMYDGSTWVTKGQLNTSTHVWTPWFNGTAAGTAMNATMGTSGHTVPFLDSSNTWSAIQAFNSGMLQLKGSTSGQGTLNPPAVASTYVWTLPAATGTLADLASTQTFTNKTLTTPVINTPSGLVKGDVGLGNVDNTSDATKNAASVTLTNKTFVCANQVSCVIRLGSDVTGTLLAASFPALTGDVTTSAGSLATAISAGAVTYAKMATASIATLSEFYAGTGSKLVNAGTIYPAEVTVTYGATTTFDFSTFINSNVTLTGNITTMTFSNVMAGKAGSMRFTQDATGSRTTVWNSILKWSGGSAPALSTAANAIDILSYSCISATFCQASLAKDVK